MKQGGCTAAATRPLGRATPLPGTKVRKARVVTKGGSHATLHTSRGKWYSLFGTEQWQDKTENRKGQLGPRRLERSGRARMLSLLLEETPPQSKRKNTIIRDRANTFGGQGGKEFTSKSQCDETMSTFEYCKFDEDWEEEKVDYFLGWWLGRTRVTAVLSPVVALARQTGGYWGKRRGTSFFKYICKKEENMFGNTFWVERRGKSFSLDPSSSNSCMSVYIREILVCLYVNNSTIPIQDHVRPHILLLERGGHQLSFGDDNDKYKYTHKDKYKDNDRRKLSSPFQLQE